MVTALVPQAFPRSASPLELEEWGVNDALKTQGAAVPSKGASVEVLPPLAYQGIKTGPDFSIEYEPNTTVPISASSEILRRLSPFTIQVEVPPVFGAASNDADAAKRKRVRAFEAAFAGSGRSYSAARQRVDSLPYAKLGYGGTVEEVIARNSSGPQVRGNASGDKIVSPDGMAGQGLSRFGEPALVDLLTAVDIAMQISAIRGTPPLVFLINPQTLQVTTNKIQQFQSRSRHGFIFQAWGEDQPQMAISARIGAYMSGGRGVQFASRRDSAAYQNLMSVVQFYKSNGYIHDTVGRSNAHHHVGSLSIRYDQWVYYGQMQSLSFSNTDTDSQLGGITFEMNFVVSAMLDTAQNVRVVQPMRSPLPSPSDPRYFGQGAQSARRESVVRPDVGSSDAFVPTFSPSPAPLAGGIQVSVPAVRQTSRSASLLGFAAVAGVNTPVAQQAQVGQSRQVRPFGVGL